MGSRGGEKDIGGVVGRCEGEAEDGAGRQGESRDGASLRCMEMGRGAQGQRYKIGNGGLETDPENTQGRAPGVEGPGCRDGGFREGQQWGRDMRW